MSDQNPITTFHAYCSLSKKDSDLILKQVSLKQTPSHIFFQPNNHLLFSEKCLLHHPEMQHFASISLPVTRPSLQPVPTSRNGLSPNSAKLSPNLKGRHVQCPILVHLPIPAYLPFQIFPWCLLEHQLCPQTLLLPLTFCPCFKWNLRKLLSVQPSWEKGTNFPSSPFLQSGGDTSMHSPCTSLPFPGCNHFTLRCCHLLTSRSLPPVAEDFGPGLITVLSLDWF